MPVLLINERMLLLTLIPFLWGVPVSVLTGCASQGISKAAECRKHRGGCAPTPVTLPGIVLCPQRGDVHGTPRRLCSCPREPSRRRPLPSRGTGGTFATLLKHVFMSVFSQMSLHLLPSPEVRVNAESFTGVKKPHTAQRDICFAEMICVCSPENAAQSNRCVLRNDLKFPWGKMRPLSFILSVQVSTTPFSWLRVSFCDLGIVLKKENL